MKKYFKIVVFEYWLETVLILSLAAMALNIASLSRFDSALMALIRSLPRGLEPLMKLLSWLTDTERLIITALGVGAIEIIVKRRDYALAILLSLLSWPAFYFMKESVRRSRPLAEVAAAAHLSGFSFPSGHSTTSFAILGLIAYLAYRQLPRPWSYIVSLGLALMIFLVGVSRVYLGAHYPTDVLGAWILGSALLLFIERGFRRAQSQSS